ncbi:MAG: M23 family metallopeptidase [Pseudomonadota bacterium]
MIEHLKAPFQRFFRLFVILMGLALAGCGSMGAGTLYSTQEYALRSGDDLADALAHAGLSETERREVILGLHGNVGIDNIEDGQRFWVQRYGSADGWLEVIFDLGAGDYLTVEVRDDEASIALAERQMEEREVAVRLNLTGDVASSVSNAGLPGPVASELQEVLDRYAILDTHGAIGASIDLVYHELGSDGSVGNSPIQFASVNIASDQYEIIRTNSPERGEFAVYRNDQPIIALGLPIEGAPITSTFGGRRHPIYGSARMHSGVDFDADYGDPVSATGDGEVVFVGWSGGLGNTVRIDHGYGVQTVYAHLSSFEDGMAEGDTISQGAVVGTVGSTGLATGSHLHYEVRVDGRATDPLDETNQNPALVASAEPPSRSRMLLDAFRSMIDDVF